MTPFCQPLPRSVAEEMLQVVARAVCDRPADNPAQSESRTRQMVLATLGFDPRDGLEYMLATLAFGHYQVILDSMNDVFHGQTDLLKAKTKTTIVALDRAMLEMMKELRLVRLRPVALSAEDARREAAAAQAAPAPPEPVAPAGEKAAMVDAGLAAGTPDEDARTGMAGSGLARAGLARAGLAQAGLAQAGVAQPEPATGETGAITAEPVPAQETLPRTDDRGLEFWLQLAASADAAVREHTGGADNPPPAFEDDGGTVEEHIAAFQTALAAAQEARAEADAFHEAKARVASGD